MSQRTKHTEFGEAPEKDGGPEQVGYKKPPKKNRFRKGQSGNGKGRPRGRQNVAKLASEMFDTKIAIRTGDGTVKLPYFEALIRVLKLKAMQGEAKSLRAMTLIMSELGFYDEKNEPEKQGVLVIHRSGGLSEEEWLYLCHRGDELSQQRAAALATERQKGP